MADEIHVYGGRKLQDALDTLPDKIEANVIRGMVRAGARAIEPDAKANAPVAIPPDQNQKRYKVYAGALRDSIRVTTRLSKGIAWGKVVAGGKKKGGVDVFYARFVEFGTKPHIIKPRKPGGVLFINGKFYTMVHHPGATGRGFMRKAFDKNRNNAVSAAASYVRKRLSTKHGIDTPEPRVEGDE